MRILIATGLYAPDIGGPATYTAYLERSLPAYGVDVVVVAFTHVRRFPKIIRHLLYMFRLIRKGMDADIIYALDTVSVGIPALVASIILRKKLYLRVPGDYAWEQGQQRFGVTQTLDEYLYQKQAQPFLVRVLAWLQHIVARRAERIVVPSEYMKRVVALWGIDARKILRIYSALSPCEVTTTREELRKFFSYTGFVVCTAARLVPWKGIEALTDAVVTIRKKGVNVHLEIFGDGVLMQKLTEHIGAQQAESYVHLRGSVSKQELAERIVASNVFVLNTSYEGLSHQLLEVMHSGVPIITTPVGGNPELITHRETGLLVSYNSVGHIVDALVEIHRNPALGELLVRNAQAHVAQFREEKVIHEFIRLIQE